MSNEEESDMDYTGPQIQYQTSFYHQMKWMKSCTHGWKCGSANNGAYASPHSKATDKRSGTRRPVLPPYPMVNQAYNNWCCDNGPVERESRLRWNQPINLCQVFVLSVDTPYLRHLKIDGRALSQLHQNVPLRQKR